MRLRYAGTCRLCGTDQAARTDAVYERATRTVRCVSCEPPADAVVERGVAGASARREFERRRSNERATSQARYGRRLGNLVWAAFVDKPSTQSWKRGAEGEERVGAMLDELANVAVLHDRRIPGSRANIDHIVVTRTRVWVVDPKRYTGRPELKVEGGILRPRVEKLMVNHRDRTKLVDGVLRQVALVQDVVGDTPVAGALCFVDADWSLMALNGFATRGVQAVYPRLLKKRLGSEADGPLDIDAICQEIAAVFKPA